MFRCFLAATLVLAGVGMWRPAVAKTPPADGVRVATVIKGWGEVTDPDGDCDVAADGDRVTIEVPGAAHDFAAELRRWNAPRVLSGVRGDFVAEVKVSGTFAPGGESTIPGRKAYNGAGLLVVADEENHVSLQRGAFRDGRGQVRHYLNFEVRRDGEQVVSKYQMNLADRDAWLRLERRGGRVTAMVSQDAGRSWRSYDPVDVELPARVRVGVEAVNSAGNPFQCAFEEYALFRRVRANRAGDAAGSYDATASRN